MADKEKRNIRGGGVLAEFQLTRQQYSSTVRFGAIFAAKACKYMCMGWGVGVCGEGRWWGVIDGLQENADRRFISASHSNLRGSMSDL